MPQLNESKLTAIKEAILSNIPMGGLPLTLDNLTMAIDAALPQFCMELTDMEIDKECDKQSKLITDADEAIGWDNAFWQGAKFVRDYGK